MSAETINTNVNYDDFEIKYKWFITDRLSLTGVFLSVSKASIVDVSFEKRKKLRDGWTPKFKVR